ncbi:ABC transporter ATP-binding protein [Kocuria rhizophila]|uniref:ABC transporter ATP-binding protein n=1 Tax=Kocuria rhizophila TaxID=72000 RepID=UPI00119DD1F7|nr:ABC transporter ATP-binding protein [Kocuria rhizophila]WTI31503.1 ATP-binding cassette domain-containing protein [Kocuria rhizophila]
MTAPVLETENLVKIYGRGDTRFDALKGINLEIGKGESVAVVGKSGSGKSTLMHLLALLDAPTHGVVALEGRPTGDLGAKELNELRNSAFGFVFQQFFLTPNQSVLENVTLPLKIAGVPASERKRRGLEALEQLEMADKADNKATDLSGGQKQRVVIARALINDPSVIFADEPTGNLDSATSKVVEDILFGLNRDKGITLVVVTHDEDLAQRCSRQIYLVDGQIVPSPEKPASDVAPGSPAHPWAQQPAEAAAETLQVTEPATGEVVTISQADAAEIARAAQEPPRPGKHAAPAPTPEQPGATA